MFHLSSRWYKIGTNDAIKMLGHQIWRENVMAHCNVATFNVINKFIVRIFFNVQNEHFVKIHWTLSGNGTLSTNYSHRQ